jgi:hypothetical protein
VAAAHSNGKLGHDELHKPQLHDEGLGARASDGGVSRRLQAAGPPGHQVNIVNAAVKESVVGAVHPRRLRGLQDIDHNRDGLWQPLDGS